MRFTCGRPAPHLPPAPHPRGTPRFRGAALRPPGPGAEPGCLCAMAGLPLPLSQHRRMQPPPPARCCSQSKERAGEPRRPLPEGFSHQSNPTNLRQPGKACLRSGASRPPRVWRAAGGASPRTLQRSRLGDRDSGVGAVTRGKNGDKASGEGSSLCWHHWCQGGRRNSGRCEQDSGQAARASRTEISLRAGWPRLGIGE